MPFVKLDVGILNSTLWIDRELREVFITALLMAEPREFDESIRQLSVMEIKETGFSAPPGWYGFVAAAGIGIIGRAKVDPEPGMAALVKLGEPDLWSRSAKFDGRRLIRIDGGFVVLNYMEYRDRDYTAADRQKRYRERKKQQQLHRDVALRPCNITQAEVEVYIKPNPPISPPPSRGNGVLTVRDRRRLNDEMWRLMELHKEMPMEQAMETACAELLLPTESARAALSEAGMQDALKRKKR